MKNKIFTHLIVCSAFIILSCSKEDTVSQDLTQSNQESAINKASLQGKAGATQISGVGFYAEPSECDAAGQGADLAVLMTGDLEGCLYIFVEDYNCSPSGTYREEGRELFVGTYNGEAGTFETYYKFEAKFEGCAEGGSPLGAEIFGRCQHPIVKGSGSGVFQGVTGRLDLKDDIELGNFPYRGHLKF